MGGRASPGAYWIISRSSAPWPRCQAQRWRRTPCAASDETTPPADNAPLPDESAVLGDALMFDPTTLVDNKPAKKLRLPSLSDPAKPRHQAHRQAGRLQHHGAETAAARMGRQDRRRSRRRLGGAGRLPVGPAAAGGRATNAAPAPPGPRSAWCRISPPSMRASIRPTIRASSAPRFKQAMPIGSNFSMTLQNSYSVTETVQRAAGRAVRSAADDDAGARPPSRCRRSGATRRSPNSTCCRPAPRWAPASPRPASIRSPTTSSAPSRSCTARCSVTTAVTDLGQPTASKKHHRRLQAELVILPAFIGRQSSIKPSTACPTAASLACGNRPIWGASAQTSLRLCRSRP